MIYILTFFLSFLINDSRVLFRILGKNLKFIKYKTVLQKLGVGPLFICIGINFCKGYFPLLIFGGEEYSDFLLSLLIFIGNYLGSYPGTSNGSEASIFWGVCCGCDYQLMQIPLAILIGSWIISKNIYLSFKIILIVIGIIFLQAKLYLMFIITLLIFSLYYGEKYLSHFSRLLNKLLTEIHSFNH